MSDFVTLVGAENYYGIKIFNIGQEVKLIKDYNNSIDQEAIRVEIKTLNTVGYVANSVNTVAKGTKSAGRIYDDFEDEIKGYIRFIVKDVAIIELDIVEEKLTLEDLLMDEGEIDSIKIMEIGVYNKNRF